MILSCAIIDDEPLAVGLLESYALRTPFLELEDRKYNSAVTALAELEKDPVDVLFLDIQMPELSGLELSHIINPDTRVIFTTAFGQYALDSYKVNALDYLMKPISYPDFLQSATKALKWYELLRNKENTAAGTPAKANAETIFVKSEYKLVQIELSKILYVEGLKDYVKIYTADDPRPIISLMSMKTMEELLPAARFIRVHRSFIVQPEKIKVIDRNRIVFGKTYIPISESYKDKFYDFLKEKALLPKL